MKDRLRVAASNSPRGSLFQEMKMLWNKLRPSLINKASSTEFLKLMRRIIRADIYVESLLAFKIQILPETDDCTWISSVYSSSKVPGHEVLKATYWRDNMVQTVLFSHVVDEALDLLNPFDFALEVGPHPAFRGQALQNVKGKLSREVPYTDVWIERITILPPFRMPWGPCGRSLGPMQSVFQATRLRLQRRAISKPT
jgi:hypothetical protein